MFQIRFVWQHLKGKRFVFLLGMFITLLTSAVVIVNPYLEKLLVDDVIRGGKTDWLLPILGMMCLVILLKTSLFMVKVVCMEVSSQHMLMSIRNKIFTNMQYQELRFFDRIRTGDIITRTTGDLEYLRHFVAYISYNAIDIVVTFSSALVMLLFISWKLTLTLLAVTPFIILTTVIYSKKVAPIYRSIREKLSMLNINARENIAGNRVVKAFAREEFEIEKFDQSSKEFKDINLRAAHAWQKIVPIIDFLAQFLSFLTILVGGIFTITGEITLGELTLFTSLTWALSDPMRRVSGMLNDLQRFWAATDKVVEICYDTPLIRNRDNAVHKEERFDGKINFKNVSFGYTEDKLVLDNVSFTIDADSTVGIIGPTGSGKTTIASLIARFYDVTSGAIYLDGVDVRFRTLESIHKAVAIATQDVFLFSDTIAGNISFCDPSMEIEQVYECAELACADGFIRKMPDGYDTIVGERGVGLSGGQRQRIALARAIAAIPSVIILDDTTSAVDMETEKQMQYNLHNLPFHCTTIIIAQRISSVKNADKIIVLENGKVDVGTHEELAARNRYYRDVCELQDEKDLPPFVGTQASEGGEA
ncbi:MAG: ABC transporter ATP-binding protein [Clostridia bacterium]|nr:ABC transporter ATP-binding protein [Clostridia bacterium]